MRLTNVSRLGELGAVIFDPQREALCAEYLELGRSVPATQVDQSLFRIVTCTYSVAHQTINSIVCRMSWPQDTRQAFL